MGLYPNNPTGAASPNPYFVGLNMTFQSTFAKIAEDSWVDKVADRKPMTTETEGFGWTDPGRRARKWVGARQAEQMAPRTYYLVAQSYEKSIEIDKFTLNDDTYGFHTGELANATAMLAKEPDYQMRDLWLNLGDQQGAYQVGLDGLSHWSAVHPVNFYDAGFGTFCNDFRDTSGVGGIGGPFAMAAYISLRYTMMLRKAAHGESVGIMPDTIGHGPTIDATVRHVLQATFLGLKAAYGATDNVGAAENMMKNTCGSLMLPDLGASLDWVMMDTKRGNKPFTLGWREMGQFVQITAEDSEPVFNRHTYIAGGYSRFVVGWGHPILSSISGPVAGT